MKKLIDRGETEDYGYDDDCSDMISPTYVDVDSYRRRKKDKISINRKSPKEDDDHYGYTDNNAGAIMDTDFSTSNTNINQVGVFRRHKKNKVKLVRKPIKKIVKKCKCE